MSHSSISCSSSWGDGPANTWKNKLKATLTTEGINYKCHLTCNAGDCSFTAEVGLTGWSPVTGPGSPTGGGDLWEWYWSKAVDKSNICTKTTKLYPERKNTCTFPTFVPMKRNRRGLLPIRLEPSHSCTENEVIVAPSTVLIVHILSPVEARRTKTWFVSGITLWTNTCSPSWSPNGPRE